MPPRGSREKSLGGAPGPPMPARLVFGGGDPKKVDWGCARRASRYSHRVWSVEALRAPRNCPTRTAGTWEQVITDMPSNVQLHAMLRMKISSTCL